MCIYHEIVICYYIMYCIYIYTHVDRYGNLQQPEMASLTVVPTVFRCLPQKTNSSQSSFHD